MELAPSAIAAGVRLIVHDALGSTNAEALALARAGERGPLWIVAAEQTAGRGRRGRAWHSPRGNLHASLLLSAPCAPALAPQLSFVAAVALHEALSACAPALAARLALKWPNDVLLDGAKLAGILVEGENRAEGFAVVAGLGVNCRSHPEEAAYPATDLAQAGFDVAPVTLFRALSDSMAHGLSRWAGGAGFPAVRAAWTARAAYLGAPIVVRAAQEARGRFEGVDDTGRLLLRGADGALRAFAAAEVQAGAGLEGAPA